MKHRMYQILPKSLKDWNKNSMKQQIVLKKLEVALEQGEKFAKKVGYEQANLMIDQREAMEHYRNILAIRIALLKRKK